MKTSTESARFGYIYLLFVLFLGIHNYEESLTMKPFFFELISSTQWVFLQMLAEKVFSEPMIFSFALILATILPALIAFTTWWKPTRLMQFVFIVSLFMVLINSAQHLFLSVLFVSYSPGMITSIANLLICLFALYKLQTVYPISRKFFTWSLLFSVIFYIPVIISLWIMSIGLSFFF